MTNSKVSVSAVVVVYNDYKSLSVLIASLNSQVDTIVIVDNSDNGLDAPEDIVNHLNVVYQRVGCNEGLGAGLNQGIRTSEEKKSDWVLLLDQDSVVSDNMIACMMDEYDRRSDREKIGLICPDVFLSDKGNHQFPLRFGRFLTKRVMETSDTIDFAITSGSLIKMSLFEVIGLMEAVFFIDYIDYDFCLRLRAEGYKILYVHQAVLTHRLGERRASNIGIMYTAHAPERVYYQTRNRLILVRRYGVRFPAFALMQLSLFALKFCKIIVVEDQKAARLRYYFSGISDSFRKQYLFR